MTVPESAAAVFEHVVRAHRRNEVVEPGPILPDETHLPGRTRVKCDSNECDFYGEFPTWYLACEAHETHVAAQLATALAQPDTLGDGDGDHTACEAEVFGERKECEYWRDRSAEMADTFTSIRSLLTEYRETGYEPAPFSQERAFIERLEGLLTATQPSATSERGGQDE